ncbi:hypothetical protein pb186bvf_019805 [Paramecium bursaria]
MNNPQLKIGEEYYTPITLYKEILLAGKGNTNYLLVLFDKDYKSQSKKNLVPFESFGQTKQLGCYRINLNVVDKTKDIRFQILQLAEQIFKDELKNNVLTDQQILLRDIIQLLIYLVYSQWKDVKLQEQIRNIILSLNKDLCYPIFHFLFEREEITDQDIIELTHMKLSIYNGLKTSLEFFKSDESNILQMIIDYLQ